MTLGESYAKERPNGLNALRLLLAIGVIFWHSFPLTGTQFAGGEPARQLLENLCVDGFFAISGYLITKSWLRSPRVRMFIVARTLRILPAFWVCLIATALIFAPLGTWFAGGDPLRTITSPESITYVVKNAGLWMVQFGIAGTPLNVPFEGAWNGSLWTLAYEFMCYLAILALGVAGLLRRSWALWGAYALVWIATFVHLIEIAGIELLGTSFRFALTFIAGALLSKYENKIRLSWGGVAIAFALVVAAAWLPNYLLLAAPAIAYGFVGLGGLVSHQRLAFRNDFSYGMYIYAFPMQQILASAGLSFFGVVGFGLVASLFTIPLAMASWFLIERPASRLNGRLQARLRLSSTRKSAPVLV
ncbi:acyltransferase family protein [Cryobacterium shii]|nr:acyltransferase [Cryobacterium shii]